MAEYKPGISILLPTRGRTDQLDRSISSLIDLADEPQDIQWCLGFDDDDTTSFNYFLEFIAPKIDASGAMYSALGFKRLGYGRLNEYVNALAHHSAGDWMVFWNDDAVMQSSGWDTVIKSHTGRFVLQAFDTHKLHPYSIFPIVPREWLTVLGHLSQHPLNDAWMSQIAWMLDIMLRIDVRVDHERFDLTGKNKDATFEERVIYEGNPKDPRDFNYIENRQKRMLEAGQLVKHLVENHGYDATRWNDIMTGKQDPWDKMLASDVNGQMQRLK